MLISCLLIQPKHPRVGFYFSKLYLKDLREDDEGTFSILNSYDRYTDIIKLIVQGKMILLLCLHFKQKYWCKCKPPLCQPLSVHVECAQEVTKDYGDEYIFDVSREAEILEFASIHNKRDVKVLWSRSGVQGQQGRVKISLSTARIRDLTQVDNGYYNLRKKDSTLIWRRLLTVKGDKWKSGF